MDTGEQPPSASARKRRRNGERVRVTRACDFCKKCTGTQPCGSCEQVKQACTFMTEYNRGKVPNVTVTPLENGVSNTKPYNPLNEIYAAPETSSHQQDSDLASMEETSTLTNNNGSQVSQNQNQDSHLNQTSPNNQVPSNLTCAGIISETVISEALMQEAITSESQDQPDVEHAGRSSRNSPEATNTDQEGHYVGPASGVSFLSRALKKLHQTNHPASMAQPSIFNFADAPVPKFDPYFLIIPTKEEADALIRRYFEFASPTHRYLHQPTVERWCQEFYDSIRNPRSFAPGAHEIRAIILGVFAVAKRFSQQRSSQDATSHDNVDSVAFFAASEHHLQLEPGGIRLTSIQARLVQCFYLLSQSRVNSAWSLFGTLANLVLAIGLHRRKKRDVSVEIDFIEHECRKRTFWSAYTLDNYLSAGLGRPRSFHEEDLDQELPLCVDDWQIMPTKILPRHDDRQSLTQASIYHAKLLKIISGILRDLYGIRRLPFERQEQTMQMYDSRLLQWRDEIRAFLDITKTEVMVPIFRRQHTVLHLAHSHAVIMLHRQALLVKSSAFTTRPENAAQADLQYSIRRCLDAATTIVTKLRRLVESGQMYSAFWFTHYYVFSALVALYLYVVQSRSKAGSNWEPYLDLAQQGLHDLKACSTETSYAQRYVVVLTELQNEAMKSAEEEAPANGVHFLYGQLSTTTGDISRLDLGGQAMRSIAGDGTVSSQEFQVTNSELGVQEPGFPNQHAMYDPTNVSSSLHDLENREAFGNLGLEGFADLAFMFAADDSDGYQAEGMS